MSNLYLLLSRLNMVFMKFNKRKAGFLNCIVLCICVFALHCHCSAPTNTHLPTLNKPCLFLCRFSDIQGFRMQSWAHVPRNKVRVNSMSFLLRKHVQNCTVSCNPKPTYLGVNAVEFNRTSE